MILKDEETMIYSGGGISLSAALISAVAKLMSALYGFGQNFGSTIRRAITKTSC